MYRVTIFVFLDLEAKLISLRYETIDFDKESKILKTTTTDLHYFIIFPTSWEEAKKINATSATSQETLKT